MFLTILKLRVENKKNKEKLFWLCGSRFVAKWPNLSVKLLRRRKSFLNLDFHGVNFGRYTLCDAIYCYPQGTS